MYICTLFASMVMLFSCTSSLDVDTPRNEIEITENDEGNSDNPDSDNKDSEDEKQRITIDGISAIIQHSYTPKSFPPQQKVTQQPWSIIFRNSAFIEKTESEQFLSLRLNRTNRETPPPPKHPAKNVFISGFQLILDSALVPGLSITGNSIFGKDVLAIQISEQAPQGIRRSASMVIPNADIRWVQDTLRGGETIEITGTFDIDNIEPDNSFFDRNRHHIVGTIRLRYDK